MMRVVWASLKTTNIKMSAILVLTLAYFFIYCATTPLLRVRRPWHRTISSLEEINIGSTIRTSVSGNSVPLLGNEELLENRIKESLNTLLKRRGFVIAEDNYNYSLELSYKSQRIDKFSYSYLDYSYGYSRLANYSSSGALTENGFGVVIAEALATLSVMSVSQKKQEIKQARSYNHTISIEIVNSANKLIWKGESTWDSKEIDLLNDIDFTTQLLLSSLPFDPDMKPVVPELKKEKVSNYFQLVCRQSFSCPALPHPIKFKFKRQTKKYEIKPGKRIHNSEALVAYVDLIKTAEFAVPLGDDNWDRPLRRSLWKTVILGKQYILEPDGKSVNVLVKLYGEKSGYFIQKAWLATDEEYADYLKKLNDWKTALRDFYDVYKK